MALERFQNPTVDSDIILRLFAYNSNAPKDFDTIQKIEIYSIDPTQCDSDDTPKTLVETIEGVNVTKDNTGEYSYSLNLEKDRYVVGTYLDIWYVSAESGGATSTIVQHFKVLPSLWFTTPGPLAYDFSFDFRPNKIRKGSKRYLIVNVTPNVPRATDIEQYYAALIVTAPIKIYIEMQCVACMPEEEDLRMVVDGAPVLFRERNDAFYQIDTTDLDEGIYNVYFEMALGDSVYLSDIQQLQIY